MFGRFSMGAINGAKTVGKGLLFGAGAGAGVGAGLYGVTKVPAVKEHFLDLAEQSGKRAASGAMSQVNVGDLAEQAGTRAAAGARSKLPWPFGS